MPASRRPPDVRLPGEEIFCPNGHKLATGTWVMGDDIVLLHAKRCDFKWPPGNAGVCGATACWLQFIDGTRVVVEVTAAEAVQMQKMGLIERLTFLNLRSFSKQRPEEIPRSISRAGARAAGAKE